MLSQGLDARENMSPLRRRVTVDEELPERRIDQDLLVHAPGLKQDFLAVSHEEKLQISTVNLTQMPVVECRDHGLAGAGRCDDQIAMPIVNRPFGIQLL